MTDKSRPTPSGTEASRCPSCGQQMRGTDWIDRILAESAERQERIKELKSLHKSAIVELHDSFKREEETSAKLARREARKNPYGFDRRPHAQAAWDLLRGNAKKAEKRIEELERSLAAMELRAMDCVAMNERQAVNFAKCQQELAEAKAQLNAGMLLSALPPAQSSAK